MAKRAGTLLVAVFGTGWVLCYRPIGYFVFERFAVLEEEGTFLCFSAHTREVIACPVEAGCTFDQILLRSHFPIIKMPLGGNVFGFRVFTMDTDAACTPFSRAAGSDRFLPFSKGVGARASVCKGFIPYLAAPNTGSIVDRGMLTACRFFQILVGYFFTRVAVLCDLSKRLIAVFANRAMRAGRLTKMSLA